MRKMHVVTLALVGLCGMLSFQAAAQTPDYAEGWINLFDGETLFGWTVFGDGQWKAQDGALMCEGGSGGWLATSCPFGDFEMTASVRVEPRKNAAIVVRASLEGHPSENGTVVIPFEGMTNGGWEELKVVANGDSVEASIDGVKVEGLKPVRKCGYIGILCYGNEKEPKKVEVKDIKLKPTNMKPLFNGKDLTGWNIIPEHKSVFSVVDGALNIKDGNGQIETDGLYKNFVAQLAIISNGDHLNSGVFVRGPKGVFWKGYESQVRNQWEGEDRTKPTDFGTGGNYGNQATRKVVSTDREWFYKTIVCDGPHMAVWINGYMTSDYLDMRPVSPENDGKAGYVPGPGTIHLQGHDPTTDLSFKDIRIQEYAE